VLADLAAGGQRGLVDRPVVALLPVFDDQAGRSQATG
jgi:hypothetical protein